MKNNQKLAIGLTICFILSCLTLLLPFQHEKVTLKDVDPTIVEKLQDTGIVLVDPPKNFVVNSTIPVNIVLIGFNESLLDTNWIDSQITHWYAPTVYFQNAYAGGNFSLDLNYFKSNTTSLETDFVTYLASIATTINPPPDLQAYDPTAVSAYLFSAVDAITWLDNNINNYFGNINDSYCFYLIDTYTWNYITDYYYYDLDMPDPDTGLESRENLTIIYGGEYPNRGIFLDLSAGPVDYRESQISESDEGVSAATITPMWEYNFPQDKAIFNANLTEYIQETIDMAFTPSYLYEPVIQDDFKVVVYIFDNTSVGDIYTNPTNYIDPTVIDNALEKLIPFSNWTTNYYVNYLDNHPALQQTIKDAYAFTNHGAYPYAINPYDSVVTYLDTHRIEFNMDAKTIPVFIFAWDEYLYFSSEFTLGFAEQDVNGDALMVLCGYNPAYYSNSGYTKLVIHEVGHILGLRHPHDGWSWDNYNDTGISFLSDWLRDLISTPMTYAHQDTVFSTFDYDTLDRGHCFERLNDSWYFLYNANSTLLNKGYTNLDESLNNSLNSALTNHSMSLQFFEQEDFESAFIHANLSYIAAKDYFDYAESLAAIDVTAPTITITSPTNSTYSNNSVTLSYTVSETASILVFLDGTNKGNIPSGGTLYSLTDGCHNLTLQAKDAAENVGTATVWMTTTTETSSSTTTGGKTPGFMLITVLSTIAFIIVRKRASKSHKK